MCGICGFSLFEGEDSQQISMHTLKNMCNTIAHRGPDGEGQYVDSGIALGHRRLSLIDLENGNQPLVRVDTSHASRVTSPALGKDGSYLQDTASAHTKGEWVIVFNGEIYNYQELRVELEQLGWAFETKSDTEVLLVSYIEWGALALNKLRGMFAFVIWNARKREMFCARDFFGIKPFYYTMQQGRFIFASEIKSILEHPDYKKELNREALNQYLCFQFSALQETFFKGIFKLPPATYAVVHADGSMDMKRYWRPDYKINTHRSFDDTVSDIDKVIHNSVHYHNVADVEVGSFLSSGIDSSYLAACLAQENPHIKTFTVGFSEYSGERDEIAWAKELADTLHIANTSKHIDEQEYWESLSAVQWHMDEPSADPSAVALYFVDKIAAEQVKAVLSGEGADEFFGGYRIYQAPLSNQKLQWVPKPLLRVAAKAMSLLGCRGANYLQRASSTVEEWYYTNANATAFSVEERDRILKYPCSSKTPQELTASTYNEVKDKDEVLRMQYVDLFFWLVGDILLKTDKMSMAHSLESRVPFLDKKVFNCAATIPQCFKVNSKQTKIALRSASERVIPQDWAQKEKLGFPVPLVAWLRQDKYYNKVKQEFESSYAKQFFNTKELLRILDEHRLGADNSRKIWIIYMFLLWYKLYFVYRSGE